MHDSHLSDRVSILRALCTGLLPFLLGGLLGTAAAAGERLVLVAGGGEKETGPAAECKLTAPFGVDFDPQGRMVIVELYGHRILRVSPQGQLERLSGNGKPGRSGNDGPATAAQVNGLHNLAITKDGLVFLSDTWNQQVRVIDSRTDQIRLFAGTGERGFSGDNGPALQAKFTGIYCVALDPTQTQLVLADLENRRVRSIDLKSGVVTTIAGNGQQGVPQDGSLAAESPLVDPRAVAVDGQGQVYILERGGHALRVVDRAGRITTVAGTGKAGYSGDEGPALQATMNGPKHLIFDQDGTLLIADTENHVIRRYDPQSRRISLVAGTGKKGLGELNRPPREVALFQPHGVYIHADGTLYLCDSGNNRVLKLVRDK